MSERCVRAGANGSQRAVSIRWSDTDPIVAGCVGAGSESAIEARAGIQTHTMQLVAVRMNERTAPPSVITPLSRFFDNKPLETRVTLEWLGGYTYRSRTA